MGRRRGFLNWSIAITAIITFGFMGSLKSAMGNESSDELVEVPVDQVFIPSTGYDDNDKIEALVEGQLPNPCFTIANATVEPISGQRAFRVHQFAWLTRKGNCGTGDLIDDPVPFTTVALLGTLPTADYQLSFDKEWAGTRSRSFRVTQAESEYIDNFNYAVIRSVDVEESYREGEQVSITLRGRVPFIGLELATPEVQVQQDTIVILPKLKNRTPSECPTTESSFKRTIDLGHLKAGTYALHIRSRGGRAVYGIVNVYPKAQ